jgi:ectoine hydroxylase-related dioxygenase (phytanoyl-CoA dioxygenase family)
MYLNNDSKKKFYDEGFLVLPNFFDENEVKSIVNLQNRNHYKKDKNNETVFKKSIKPLADYEDYWHLLSNNKILKTLKNLLDDKIVYLHNSHSVIQKNEQDIDINWHRDNACRVFGLGPDWDKKISYNVLRVAIYLPETDYNTGLGVIPKTHKDKNYICSILRNIRTKLKRIYHSKYFKFFFNNLFGKNIYVKQGDCVIFMANLYHRSLSSSGTRRAIFLSYGTNNKHARNYLDYYFHHREDAAEFKPNTNKIDENEFKNFLINAGIYIDIPKSKKQKILKDL